MKKIQFMSLMALMLLVSNTTMAQLDSKSEISFSVGTYTPNEKGFAEAIGEGLGTAIGQMVATIITFGQVDLTSKTQKEESYSPTFNLQYLYRVAPKVKVGASLTYQHTSAKLMAEKQSGGYLDIAKATNDYFTVMPVAKFMWIEKDHIGLYSKAAIRSIVTVYRWIQTGQTVCSTISRPTRVPASPIRSQPSVSRLALRTSVVS